MPDLGEDLSLAGAEADQSLGFTYNELLAELVGELIVERPPNSVTTLELAKSSGKTRDQAHRFLENKVKIGELKKVKMLLEGGQTWVYYRGDNGRD